MNNLLAISPIDGRYAEKTKALASYCSEFALMRFRLKVELHWLRSLATEAGMTELPELSKESLNFLERLEENFDLAAATEIKTIEAKINHDVKAVEYYLKNQFKKVKQLDDIKEFLHFACTSEDMNNVSYALMFQAVRNEVILPHLYTLLGLLETFAIEFASLPMLARTHGQAASPTTVGKEFANFAHRLQTQIHSLEELPISAKCNGAVGNFNAHYFAYPELDWPALSRLFIESLGLHYQAYSTQIEPHDDLAALLHCLSRIHTLLIDLAQDLWGYIALGYFKLDLNAEEVGSSTMPHKINPIDFENAEGNLGLASTLCQHLALKLPISRFQRDLSGSTVLRNLGSLFAYHLLGVQSLTKGLTKITPDATKIADDLHQHWEIVSEGIQTLLRRHGYEAPYEALKTLTRGKKVTQKDLQTFIDTLKLPKNLEEQLRALSPENYLGVAATLALDVSR